ncbi:lymphocyte cytosolic protein 2 [Coregonus clupeaformis]|uniref:lymphocyte cytosolic protein 2 n=1 Tax=Coregonus clupeaformis TaxID=59861 RepID=UPI001BE0500D|nr:lymphocyte cytosolic protein 2 [Coregonus clupeaformis]
MSFDSVPAKSEVMGWNARSLADYMKRLRLSSCDKVVMKTSMNGARFLKMKDGDLQKFPTIHIPVITKICSEINRSEEEKWFGQRSKEPKNHQQDFVHEVDEAWDSEEFEMSDNDYENPDEDDSYISALSDRLPPPPPAEGEEEEGSDDDYEPPPSSATEEIPRLLNLTKPLGNSDYIDSVCGGPSIALPTGRTPRPPQRPGPQAPAPSRNTLARPPTSRLDPSPQRPFKAAGKPPTGPSVPLFDRSKKPGQPAPTKKQPPHYHANTKTTHTREGSPFRSPQPAIVKPPQLEAPTPPDYRSSSSKPPPPALPAPPSHPPPSMVRNTKPGTEEDMVPVWYGGLVTRGQAEASLRWVNKDGAFLVRDSSKGSSEQPYTLMVLNQGKVYNVQIRHQGNTYHLGTGLMGIESFPGVKEMIDHYTHTPLLLIDMEIGTGAQSQCCLLHPATL